MSKSSLHRCTSLAPKALAAKAAAGRRDEGEAARHVHSRSTTPSAAPLPKDVHQVVIAPAGEHSEKPDEVYRRIEHPAAAAGLRQWEAGAMTAPLEALLRRMSRMAETVFDKDGDIDPIWLIETASSEQQMLVTPVHASSPLEALIIKETIAKVMREKFAELGVVRYAGAAECWTVEGQRGPYLSLSEHPQRKEVIDIFAQDGREFLEAIREIIRPPHGKSYLGKLSEIIRPEHMEGRFLDLLPRATR